MTKLREPLTYQHTLTQVAAVIGWDRCGAVCGVSGRAVRHWSDHDCETEIRMIDAERLDRAFMDHGGTYAPFHRLLSLRLEIASHAPGDVSLAEIAAEAAKESGEAVAALIDAALHPSDPAARRRARKEGEEALAAITDGLAALDRQQQGDA
ncbi:MULTISPECIES: hypothetical protein [unclassified Novosphingobium]|uniref:hypothetical protein n=1 Tax=unclassified Novosphingobium TaxID=2644732 RepID=UPI000D32841C|nr:MULTISPECIES: hypothetical protein [unclassified Novosphingobium]PTR08900.1 hypothetical protein C8K11_110163 [Novosphingobium sp. GV055]PUB01812.1 hypothetical protein C8K12_110163 [Novosphingobium sp. GV061]PUB17784.1 hypothetical protein C8K14_110163 [Novosphingobium sp. GV079]PUB40478.1 hypothetical protein C8K10_110163 [Novosphingobium sp. GV027]